MTRRRIVVRSGVHIRGNKVVGVASPGYFRAIGKTPPGLKAGDIVGTRPDEQGWTSSNTSTSVTGPAKAETTTAPTPKQEVQKVTVSPEEQSARASLVRTGGKVTPASFETPQQIEYERIKGIRRVTPTPAERAAKTSFTDKGVLGSGDEALRDEMLMAQAKKIVREATPKERARLYGSTMLSSKGYELIGGAVTGKHEDIVARQLVEQYKRNQSGETTEQAFLRGVIEGANSPVVETELMFLYPGAAGATASRLAATKIGQRAIMAAKASKFGLAAMKAGTAAKASRVGQKVLRYGVGKAVNNGILAGTTGMEVAQVEALRRAGRTEEAAGRAVMIPTQLAAFAAGIRFGKKAFYQKQFAKEIKQAPPAYRKEATARLAELHELKNVQLPAEKIDLTDVNLPKPIQREAEKLLLRNKKGLVIGGSLSLKSQKVPFTPERLTRADIDAYIKPSVLGNNAASELTKRRALAKEAAQMFRKALPSSDRGNIRIKGTKVYYGNHKVIEFQSSRAYVANVEAVSPTYSIVSQTWRKTPRGVRVMKAEVGAKRKVAALVDPKRIAIGKAREKDIPDLQRTIITMQMAAGPESLAGGLERRGIIKIIPTPRLVEKKQALGMVVLGEKPIPLFLDTELPGTGGARIDVALRKTYAIAKHPTKIKAIIKTPRQVIKPTQEQVLGHELFHIAFPKASEKKILRLEYKATKAGFLKTYLEEAERVDAVGLQRGVTKTKAEPPDLVKRLVPTPQLASSGEKTVPTMTKGLTRPLPKQPATKPRAPPSEYPVRYPKTPPYPRLPKPPKAVPYKPPKVPKQPPYKPPKPPTRVPYPLQKPPKVVPYKPPKVPPAPTPVKQPYPKPGTVYHSPYPPRQPPKQPPYRPPVEPLITPPPITPPRRPVFPLRGGPQEPGKHRKRQPARRTVGPQYKPSLLGIIRGVTAQSPPHGGRATGLGIRPVIVSAKNARKRGIW